MNLLKKYEEKVLSPRTIFDLDTVLNYEFNDMSWYNQNGYYDISFMIENIKIIEQLITACNRGFEIKLSGNNECFVGYVGNLSIIQEVTNINLFSRIFSSIPKKRFKVQINFSGYRDNRGE